MIHKVVASAWFLVALSVLPSRAQSADQFTREAEIRGAVPYVTMLREFPTLTLDEYNAAVKELAKTELAATRFTRPAPPALPTYGVRPMTPSTTTANRISS